MSVINGSGIIDGTIPASKLKDAAEILPAQMKQRTLQAQTIPWFEWRVWDALATVLPTTAATDDLSIDNGSGFGTDTPYISAGDVKATSGTRYARAFVRLPDNYEDGQTATLRFHAGILTTVSDTSCTLDVDAYLSDEEGSITGSNLYTGAALTINSLTLGDKDFALTATNLVAGSLIDLRIAVIWVDSATATTVEPIVAAAKLLCDTRGG